MEAAAFFGFIVVSIVLMLGVRHILGTMPKAPQEMVLICDAKDADDLKCGRTLKRKPIGNAWEWVHVEEGIEHDPVLIQGGFSKKAK
jgi:hypothetical protein